MEFQLREYTAEDYEMVKSWWEAHGGDIPPALPLLGVVVMHKGEPVCAEWLFMDNSIGACMPAFFVSNPEAKGYKLMSAFKFMQGGLEAIASEHDYNLMITTSEKPFLIKMFQRCGFKIGMRGAVQLWKWVKEDGDGDY